jgi:peptide/nickel transport system substrate-binding protein
MKKIWAVVLMTGICIGAWAGGNSQQRGTDGERDIIVGVGTEPIAYVPFDSRQSSDNDHILLYNLYDSLLYKDTRDGSVKPWLAEKWEVSADGLQIKFKLREDVLFHDGSKLTANDVKFTYDSAKNLPIGQSLLINYDYTEVVDNYNFIVHMTHPYNAILNSFCSRASFIISKAHFDKVGGIEGYKKNPVGSGGYKFVSVASGDSIILERNENYWAGKPNFRRLTIKIISDINTQILALESGDIQVLLGAPIENLQLLKNQNVAWDAVGSNATHMLQFFNEPRSPLGLNQNFRKAVQYAIDKNAINTAVFGGKADIIDMYGSPAFSTRPKAGTYSTYTRDLTKAREYLAASGYKGEDFRIICQSGTINQKSAEVIQGSLAAIGINAKIIATDNATFQDIAEKTGEYDAQLVAHNSSVMDEDGLYLYFSKIRYSPVTIRYTRGDELDALVVEARQSPDNTKRLANYTRAATIINEDAYTVYIAMDVISLAYRTGLKNVRPDMAKYYRVFEWGY